MEPGGIDTKNLSQEDVSKLTKAMKSNEFQSHMDEYCKEISDPAHRKEYLQYLDQLEAKGEMPDGQTLLRTEPGCCVKTTIMFKNGQTQKCFINIVHSERLTDMSEDDDGKGGKRVSLPYSLGPPRPERDNKDENCMTCDFAVSTWTFGQAIQRPQILKMLIDTASDGLGSQFLKGHEEVKKDFKVMRRIRCRGPGARPLPMSVKGELLKDQGKNKRPAITSFADKSAVTPSELREMRKDAKEKQLKPPAPSKEDDEEEAPKKVPELTESDFTKPGGAPRIRVPKHRLVHSGAYDLTDFMEASNRPTILAQSVPRVLKLVVELPSVKKGSDVTLDVQSDNVCIEVPGKYYLDLPLSYEIDEEKGEAKFDKGLQTLTLTLPVKPKPPDPRLLANRGGLPSQVEEIEGESDGEGALSEGGQSHDELPPLEDPPAPEDPAASPVAPPPSQPATTEPVPSAPSQPQQPQKEAFKPPPRNEDLVPEEELLPFIASDSFAGAKQGYFFTTGDEGLGYYRDRKQVRPARQASSEVPAVVPEALQRPDANTDNFHGVLRPLIEEVEGSEFKPAGFESAVTKSKTPVQRPPLPLQVQEYVDASCLLTSRIAASDIEESQVGAEPSVTCHQTRQNLIIQVGVLAGQEVAGLQLSFVNRRLTILFFARPVGGKVWLRHHLRRTLCQGVDSRQWHPEAPRPGSKAGEAQFLIVLRKEHAERWSEVFDTSTAAVAANREPIIEEVLPAHAGTLGDSSADPTAAADTAAGIDADAIEDSAELDIAAPAGAPVSLGPAGPGGAKDGAASAGPRAALNKSAITAAAQSAAVMGQGVLLQTRLMYQLF